METEVHSLYGGGGQLFTPENHPKYVVIRDKKYPAISVTTALEIIDKPALKFWAVNQAIEVIRPAISPGVEHAESYLEEVYAQARKAHRQTKSTAAERGTLVHAALTGSSSDELVGADDSVKRKLEQAQAWLKEKNVSFIHTELPVYSRRFRYSGRLDGIARLDEVLSLLDWKTGKGVYPEFRLQMAAYIHAYEEEHPQEEIQQYICLHLQEDKVVPHLYPRASLRKDFNGFLAALRLHQRLKEIGQEEKLSH